MQQMRSVCGKNYHGKKHLAFNPLAKLIDQTVLTLKNKNNYLLNPESFICHTVNIVTFYKLFVVANFKKVESEPERLVNI